MRYSPKWSRFACIALMLSLLFTGVALSQPYNLPPRLAPGHFLWDDANLLHRNNRATLADLQKRIYAQTNSPLVVVTIDRMSAFTSQQSEIDAFARAWFNHWAIGSEADNTGILLLVSREDRQAWIELGTAWGRRWDSYRERIIRGMMLPLSRLESGQRDVKRGQIVFSKGDASGILAGARALANMAVQGLHGVTPSLGIVAELMTIPFIQTVQEWQSLSPRWWLGVRRSELINLDVLDFDAERKRMAVHKGKGGKTRVIPIMNDAYLSDLLMLIGSRKTGPIFLSNRHHAMSLRSANRIVATLGTQAGITNPNPRLTHLNP